MKSIKLVILVIFIAFTMTACGANGRYQVTLITEGNHKITEDLNGDLVMLGGETTLESDTVLHGSVHLIDGKFHINGEIIGDVSFLGGALVLKPGARITGDLNHGGGDISGLSEGMVTGPVKTGSGLQIPSITLPQEPNANGKIIRWVINAFLMGLLALILERYLPGPVRLVSQTALQHSIISIAMGTLVGIVGVSLLVLLAYTIILIPVALLGMVVMGVAIFYSWVTYGMALGRLANRLSHGRLTSRACAFWGTFVFMLLLNALVVIPAVGSIFGILTAVLGLGAVFLTRFGMRRFIPADQWEQETTSA